MTMYALFVMTDYNWYCVGIYDEVAEINRFDVIERLYRLLSDHYDESKLDIFMTLARDIKQYPRSETCILDAYISKWQTSINY